MKNLINFSTHKHEQVSRFYKTEFGFPFKNTTYSFKQISNTTNRDLPEMYSLTLINQITDISIIYQIFTTLATKYYQ